MIPFIHPSTASGQAAWAVIFALGAGCFWALAQVLGKLSVRKTSSLGFNCIRFTVFLPFTYLLVRAQGTFQKPDGIALVGILASGILSWNASAQLYFYVLQREDMSIAAPLSNSYPALAAVLAVLVLGERPSAILAPVLVMCVFGIWLLAPNKTQRHWRWGVPMSLTAALGWAVSLILTKHFVTDIDPASLLLVKVLGSALVFWITAAAARTPLRPAVNIHSFLAGLCLSIGETSFMCAIALKEAAFVSPILSSTIPFGFFFSVFFLKERPLKARYVGMFLVFAAVLILYLFG